MGAHVLLVDGHSIANRAFYSSPDLTSSTGLRVGTTLTFFQMLLRYIRALEITHLAFAFDLPQKTFRHQLFPEYKAQRSAPVPEFREDLALIRNLIEKMGFPIYTMPGYEADDVVGSLSRVIGSDAHVYLLSGDRDYLQLVNEHVTQVFPQPKGQYTHYTLEKIQQDYHCTPEQFIDLKALQGDSSDNIPGLDKVGPKTAGQWLGLFPSIDALYAHFDELPATAKRKLQGQQDYLEMMRSLVRIRLDLPLEWREGEAQLDSLAFGRIQSVLQEIGGRKLQEQYGQLCRERELEVDLSAEPPASLASFDCRTDIFSPQVDASTGAGEALVRTEEQAWREADIPETWDWIGVGARIPVLEAENRDICWIADVPAQCLYSLSREQKEGLEAALEERGAKLVFFSLRPFWIHGWTWKLSCCLDLQLLQYLHACETHCQDLIRLAQTYDLPIPIPTGKKPQEELVAPSQQAIYLDQLAPMVCAGVEERGLWDLYWEMDLPLLPLLVSMQEAGVAMDETLLIEAEEAFRREVHAWEEKIHGYAGHTFNISSPKQLAEVLYDELGLPTGRGKRSKLTTSADWLEQIRLLHPIVGAVLEYRQVTKLLSTYVQGLRSCLEEDGRIHSQFLQTSTNTGRLSSVKPNLQNLPIRRAAGRVFRAALRANPGWVLVDADYSQIELRLLAHLSGESSLIQAFQDGTDVHRLTAAELFSVPMDQVTPEQRAQGKIINFSIIYGITAYGLSQDLGGTVAEAKEYIERYFRRYPKVQAYLDRVVEEAKSTGRVQTLYGRQRAIPELLSSRRMEQEFGQRAAKNAPIQGTAADLMRKAMLRVQERIEREGLQTRLILQIHDELILEAPESEQEQARILLREEMEQATKLLVPLEVEVGIGKNWLEAKA